MQLLNKHKHHKIAITGMSSLLPGAHNQQQFWENIVKGRNMIKDTPDVNWRIDDYYDPSGQKDMTTYAKTGGFLDPVLFDPMEFGMPPNSVPVTDTVQLLSLIAARDVLNDTKSYQAGKVDKKKVSVILGVAAGTETMEMMGAKVHWPELLNTLRSNGVEESLAQKIAQETRDSYGIWNENTFPGLLSNVVAGRIANRFDLGGTNSTMDAACASSLTAIKNAMQELQLGNTDMVISGGADALSSIFMYMCFSQTGALSKTGDCRAFDDKGDGTILGEGLAFFTLKRLEDAIAQEDRIYAVLASMGSSSDGKSKSIYAPDSQGQALAIQRAHESAGTTPDEIELIEAHGTGTVAGDSAEFNGLKLAFGEQQKRQFCALGSIKSQIGHTKSAAGAASLQKVALALYNKVIPPTIKVERPNEKMEIEQSPFYLNTSPKPWITNKKIRRAGVSSFGFGGTNFHGIVEEYSTTEDKKHYVPGNELILLAAEDKPALRSKIEELDQQLESDEIIKVAKVYQKNFNATAPHRLAMIIGSKHDFLTIKKMLISLLSNDKTHFEIPNQVYYSSGSQQMPLALVCSGQGSQYLNMGRELINQFPQALEGYATTADLLYDDKNLHEVTFPVSTFNEEDLSRQKGLLNDTRWAQPTIGNLTIAHHHLLNSMGLVPSMIAGHSYGELSALYWSGAIKTPSDLINISRKRGELMATASTENGAMTAVFAGGEQVEKWLSQLENPLEIANYNSPDQTVVSGRLADIEKLEAFLSEHKQDFRRLPVSTAFHSKLVADAAVDFEAYLEQFAFGKSKIDVFGNIDGEKYKKSKKSIVNNLSNQLKSPVRFTEEVENMYEEGARIFLEVGPGNNLTSLIKQTLTGKDVVCISLDGHKKQESKSAFWIALGQLAVAGITLDFSQLWDQFEESHPKKTDYSPVAVEITGANYGKPYPEKTGMHPPVSKPKLENQSKNEISNFDSKPNQNKQMTQKQTVSHPNTQSKITNTSINTQIKPDRNVGHENTIPSSAKSKKHMDKNNTHAINQPSWVNAFSQIQQNMHSSQMEFMRMMVENQNQFLQLSASLLSNQPVNIESPSRPQPVASLPVAKQEVVPYSNGQSKMPLKAEIPAASDFKAQANVSIPPPVVETQVKPSKPVSVPAPKPAPAKEPQAASKSLGTEEVAAKLTEIVAEKTGYPSEVLDLDANLESGLGIDSIKRVQILSALQKEYTELKGMDNTLLAKMDTLKEILDYAYDFLGQNQPEVAAPSVSANAAPSASAETTSSLDLAEVEKTLLGIVAEKTGYPAEVLDMEAQLESGLGIDSIKRVQILSSLQKEYPVLKGADTSKLAKMETLQEIVNYAMESFGEEDTHKKKSVA
ncbi:MAG: beta-ketoacyl synthase N-terminal-like domain-containing protein [Bacteroidota bacterium]